MLGRGGTGVSTYARSLTTAIGRGTDHSYRLMARDTGDGRWRKWADALRGAPRLLHEITDHQGAVLEGRDVFRRAHVHFSVRRRLYPLRCDLEPGIMHWTYPVPMQMEGWINLYTVHDTIPLDRPDLTLIDPRRYRAVLEAIIARGDGITTVSKNAGAAIVSALGCDPAFVVDTKQPIDTMDVRTGPLPAGLVRRSFFLVVVDRAAQEPRRDPRRVPASVNAAIAGRGRSRRVAGRCDTG